MPILRMGMCPLLTSDVLDRCRRAGIKSALEFVSTDPRELRSRCRLSYQEVIGISHVLQAQFAAFPQNALHLYHQLLSTLAIFSTGCASMYLFRLDDILDGGIYTGEITEIVGPPAVGKTQLCHSLLTTVCLETQRSVVYIDTGGSFSPQRIVEILKNKKTSDMESKDILQRIHSMKVYDIFELLKTLEELKLCLCSQVHVLYQSLKLIILDSVTSIISPHLGIQNSDGQGLMVHLAHLLKTICSDHALAVVVCNNTVKGEDAIFKPALGQYWKFVPSVTVQIERDSHDRNVYSSHRKISVTKSSRQFTPVSMMVKISYCGIEAEN